MMCIEHGEQTVDAMVLGAESSSSKPRAWSGKANYIRSEERRRQKRIAYQGKWSENNDGTEESGSRLEGEMLGRHRRRTRHEGLYSTA